MSDTYWPHQYERLLQQLYAFLCVHCEYFYYIYFVDFPREGSSLPFCNQNVWVSYGAKGMKLQNITITHAKSIKFHPNGYPIEEAMTSVVPNCTKQSHGPTLFNNTCYCSGHTFQYLITVTGVRVHAVHKSPISVRCKFEKLISHLIKNSPDITGRLEISSLLSYLSQIK